MMSWSKTQLSIFDKRCHDVLVRLVGRDFRKLLWTKWKYMPNTDIKIMCINVMIYDCLSDATITVVWIEIISTWVKSTANLLCYSDNCSMKSLFLSRCLLNNTDFVTLLIWSFTSSVVFIIGRGRGLKRDAMLDFSWLWVLKLGRCRGIKGQWVLRINLNLCLCETAFSQMMHIQQVKIK